MTEVTSENGQTPDEIRAEANKELIGAVERQEARREAKAVKAVVDAINAGSQRETEDQIAVKEAVAIVAPAPETRPALAAARTQFASLGNHADARTNLSLARKAVARLNRFRLERDVDRRSHHGYGLCHSVHAAQMGETSNRPSACAVRRDENASPCQISSSDWSGMRPITNRPCMS